MTLGLAYGGAEAGLTMGAQTVDGIKTFSSAVETTKNIGTSGATSVKEYGDGFNHITVLTATALDLGDIANNAAKAVGGLIYTFPAGAIVLESVYINLKIDPAGAENDAVVGDLGIGSLIAIGPVSVLSGTAGFEDMLNGQAITYDGLAATIVARQSTVGGPMFIASGDEHTVHVNTAAAWLTSASQATTYTGVITLVWKFLE